jgi:hypothetical protein
MGRGDNFYARSQSRERWLLAKSSVCPSVCPSAWNNSNATERIFTKCDISAFFRKPVEKIQVQYIPTCVAGTSHEDICVFMTTSRSITLKMRKFSDKAVDETKIHNSYSITSFRKSCHFWDEVEKYGTAGEAINDKIIRSVRNECWITKTTHTHTHTHTHTQICNTYYFSTAPIIT